MSNSIKCEKCAGQLRYVSGAGCVECVKCKTNYNIEFDKSYAKHKIDMNGPVTELPQRADGYVLKCTSCGASFHNESSNITSVCKYCGAHLVEDFEKSLSTKPDAIIPFAFSKEDVKKRYLSSVRKKLFIPNVFKKFPEDGRVESLYIPAFVFNISSTTKYNGKIEYSYNDENGESTTSTRRIEGEKSFEDKDVFYECSDYITQDRLEEIKPYDMNGAVKYNPVLLLGYSVEHFNSTLQKIRDEALAINLENIKKNILNGYSYDRVIRFSMDVNYTKASYSYVVLPSYKITYTYKGKKYDTYMNGQTGKLDQSMPKSILKILFAFFLGFGISVGIILFIASLIIK